MQAKHKSVVKSIQFRVHTHSESVIPFFKLWQDYIIKKVGFNIRLAHYRNYTS